MLIYVKLHASGIIWIRTLYINTFSPAC